jgi:methyl-accepting chemotaxis protein
VRRRATGIVGQVAGIIGIVVSLALIVGVLYVRGWGTDTVTEVAANVDAAIARTEPMLETAAAKVDEVAQRVGEVAAAAEAVSLDPNATPAALQGILDGLAAVSERYTELRTGYAAAREQVVSILDRLALVDRLIPGIDIPEGPVDALASLDERARAIDAQIMELIDAGLAVQGVNRAAAAIAEKARQVEAGLGTLAAGVEEVGVRLDELRADIADIASTVNTVITILCVALVLLLLYMALLHWVLFRSSRGYGRGASAA